MQAIPPQTLAKIKALKDTILSRTRAALVKKGGAKKKEKK